MLVIYLFHAYVYCQLFDERLMGLIYVTINVFVVVSGYLFYQNHAAENTRHHVRGTQQSGVLPALWPDTGRLRHLAAPYLRHPRLDSLGGLSLVLRHLGGVDVRAEEVQDTVDEAVRLSV